jgi:hypothetical protein
MLNEREEWVEEFKEFKGFEEFELLGNPGEQILYYRA